jgi:hypothetical protein
MRKAGVGFMLSAVMLFALAGPAASAPPGFQVTPASGPAGTTIHASDPQGECDGNNALVTITLKPQSGPSVASTTIVPNGDGTWTKNLTVPNGTDPGTFSVTAHCEQDQGADSFDYDPQTFTVTGTATTTVPTTTTTVPTPVMTPPATAVTATPTLTG